MRIALGADHAGVALKGQLRAAHTVLGGRHQRRLGKLAALDHTVR